MNKHGQSVGKVGLMSRKTRKIDLTYRLNYDDIRVIIRIICHSRRN